MGALWVNINPIPYTATVSVSVAAVMVALQLDWLALPVSILYFFISRYCLNLVAGKTKESNPYKQQAEQIAMLGMIVFLPLIFTLGIDSALLIFVVFAQLALNLQTFEKRQWYLGLALSFALITFSASQSRNGSFILFFIPYCLLLCACLFTLTVTHFRLSLGLWFKSSALLLVCTLIVYLIMPRFPALLYGATPGSEHFYHDNAWLERAERNEPNGTGFSGGTESEPYVEPGIDESSEFVAGSPEREFQQALQGLQEALEANQQKFGDDLGEGGQSTRDQKNKQRFGQESEESEDKSGFGEPQFESDLGIENQSRQNPNIVMYVRSNQPLYLTTQILDRFDGLSWSQSNERTTYIKENKGQFIENSKTSGIISLSYEVELAEMLTEKIPMSFQPAGLSFPASVLLKDNYGSFKASKKLEKGTAYQATLNANWYQGRLVYPVDEGNLYPYLTLPDNLDNRITQLALEVTSHGADQWQKAQLLEQHLRENYQYTLDTVIESQGVTPLSEFLFETRYGHCEYFASAMALMLRTLGIPSRVVNGYAATDQNPLTGYIEVRGTDGHAWTEAYHEGLGWVPYEPTSYYQLPKEETESPLTYEEVNEYVERQLEILKQQGNEASFKQIALQTWQSIGSAFAILILALKWLISEYGQHILAVMIGGVVLWMLYRQLLPMWRSWQLKRLVSNYHAIGSLADYEFYIQAIRDALALQQLPKEFSTIEDFISQLKSLGLDLGLLASDDFLQHFNKLAYSEESVSISESYLNNLASCFEQLWQSKPAEGATPAV